jgi:hypothetical protein
MVAKPEVVVSAPMTVENIGMPSSGGGVPMELPPDTTPTSEGPTIQNAFATHPAAPRKRPVVPVGEGDGVTGSGFEGLVAEIGRRVGQHGGKTGDVQISLMWNNFNDLDLHVVCPHSHRIFFQTKSSPCGGVLDIDMNAGGRQSNKPVENIVWPAGAAPPGHYAVYVHHFANHGDSDPSAYAVRTLIRGKEQIYKGSVTPFKMQLVCQFDLPPPSPDSPLLGGGGTRSP